MPTDKERRELARRVRSVIDGPVHIDALVNALGLSYAQGKLLGFYISESSVRHIADLIDPDTQSSDDANWRTWYEGLCHTDGDDSPENLREVLEDIVWAVLTIDLGPNGNVCQGVDEGIVQTESLLDAWESEIRAVIEPEPERTCHVESWHYETEGDITFIECELSCGHEIDCFYLPDFCPNCGAKVVR